MNSANHTSGAIITNHESLPITDRLAIPTLTRPIIDELKESPSHTSGTPVGGGGVIGLSSIGGMGGGIMLIGQTVDLVNY